jgi:N-acetylglutamate synthase-like GNAT family acetyltransferase
LKSHSRIRDAESTDIAAIQAVFRRASLSNTGDRSALLENAAALEWDENLVTDAHVRVLSDQDSTVAGFATTSVNGKVAELVDLFVDPEARLRGYGAELVRDALQFATAAGCKTLEVTANPHASEFYASVGFGQGPLVETEFGSGERMTIRIVREEIL